MTIQEFRKAINMGLGSAILELKKNKNNDQYKDALLYAVTHNTCYDAQCENTRGNYIFEAIKLVWGSDFLEKVLEEIIECFYKTNDFHLSNQLCDVLYCFWKDGYDRAGEAIWIKFENYLQNIENSNTIIGDQREILENTAISLCDVYGFKGFFVIAKKIGNLMLKTEKLIFTDWFFECACNKFGEKQIMPQLVLQAETSLGKKRFLEEILLEKARSEERDRNRKIKIERTTIESYIEDVKNGKVFIYNSRRLAKNISLEERIKIADIISETDDYKIKIGLMRVFSFIDYPYTLEKLFSIYKLESRELKEYTLEAMARFKDKRLHDLAVFNLKNSFFIIESLQLLRKNFHNDYDLIYSIQRHYHKKCYYDYHSLSGCIQGIFSKRKNPKAFPILLFDYYKNPCSHCRTYTIEIMRQNKCLPENIIAECLYDCSLDTRKLAKRCIVK